MKNLLKKISPYAFILLLVGCNEKLTREVAKEKIISELKLPLDEIKPFKVDDNTYFADKTAKQYEQLKKMAMLDYTFEGEWASQYHAKASLTDNGKKFVVSEERDQGYFTEVDVKVAKIEFGEITGIQEIKQGDLVSYVVEYTINRKEINPFGKTVYDLNEKTIKKKIKFNKFDDGWRPGDFENLEERLVYEFDKSEDEFF